MSFQNFTISLTFGKWDLAGVHFLGQGICGGGEFVFLEYRVFFRSQHGTILGFFSSKVYHGMRQNIGFTQLGAAIIAKAQVATSGGKGQKTLQIV